MSVVLFFVVFCISSCSAALYDEFYDETQRCVKRCSHNYLGDLNTTFTGKDCRFWTQSDVPHGTDISTWANKCRNPDGFSKVMPWCFTNNTQWDYCFSSKCVDTTIYRKCEVPGFYHFNGTCQAVLPMEVHNKSAALNLCKRASSSSRLSTLLSSNEVTFLKELTCFPVIVSGKRRQKTSSFTWRQGETWGIGQSSGWPWCPGHPVSNKNYKCVVLQQNRCFTSVRCIGPEAYYYPGCQLNLKNLKIRMLDSGESVTWKSAISNCSSKYMELCNSEDLCNMQPSDHSKQRFLTHYLPRASAHWVPVGDEFDEWVYVGPLVNQQCSRVTTLYGPGLSPNQVRNKGKIMCCKPENRTLPVPKPLKVYVFSATFERTTWHRFSLSPTFSKLDLQDEDILWLPGSRQSSDLGSFTLMSHYSALDYNTPIYFCSKPYITQQGWRTKLYSISTKHCNETFRLEFYAFASNTTLTNISLLFKKDENLISKVALGNRFNASENSSSPHILVGALNVTFATKTVNDPCQKILKLSSPNGVITYSAKQHDGKNNTRRKCKWRIIAPKHHTIRINITKLSLQIAGPSHSYFQTISTNERFRSSHGNVLFNHQQDCPKSELWLHSPTGRRNTPNWVDYGHFCGFNKPPTFSTIDNVIVVEVISTARADRFRLTYEMLEPPSNLTVLVNNDNQTTWLSAQSQCQSIGMDLCFHNDICRYENRPFYGIKDGSVFMPILDEFNDWVQIGYKDGQACQRHNPYFGAPTWGLTNSCLDQSCETLYCCNRRRKDGMIAEELVTITVYSTLQNGIVFQRYIRESIDPPPTEPIWSKRKISPNLVSTFQLFSGFEPGFQKLLYFCFKLINPPVGRLATVYSVSENPCTDGWRMTFYLYGSDGRVNGTTQLYVGAYGQRPGHTALSFNSYESEFRSPQSFRVFAITQETPPPPVEANIGGGISSTSAGNASSGAGGISTNSLSKSCKNGSLIDVVAPAHIVSPGYSDAYPPNAHCRWFVHLPPALQEQEGSRLRVDLIDMYLERHDTCRLDFVLIQEARYNSSSGKVEVIRDLDRLCGSQTGRSHTVDTSLLITFKSDYSLQRRGFKLQVKTVIAGCGGKVTGNGALVNSPGFPERYEAGLSCNWTVEAPSKGYWIEIQFKALRIPHSAGCAEDSLRIGPNATQKESQVFCGIYDEPPVIRVNHSRAFLHFSTLPKEQRLTSTGKGFSLVVRFVPASEVASPRNAACGLAEVAPWSVSGPAQARIVGGVTALPNSWPWVVYIEGATCGGTILSDRWIISAAHCFVPANLLLKDWSKFSPKLSRFSVLVGRHYVTVATGDSQTYKIERVVINPRYNRTDSDDGPNEIPVADLALIKVTRRIHFSPTAKPACLPAQDARVGAICVIAGWGQQGLAPGRSVADFRIPLRYARLPILKNSLCNSWPGLIGKVSPHEICAGYPQGGVDSCWGDSGGPLMCRGRDNRFHLAGVVSWGKGCGKPRQPGIYSRVWSHYQWITETIYGV